MLFVLGHNDVNFLSDDSQYDQNSPFVANDVVDELPVYIPLVASLIPRTEETPLEQRHDHTFLVQLFETFAVQLVVILVVFSNHVLEAFKFT